MERRILFKVLMGVGGHEYVVYTDGTVEGFGEGAIVFNYHPELVAVEVARHSGANGTLAAPVCET
jgi:hypothetical protein